jgi:hypothetical protein
MTESWIKLRIPRPRNPLSGPAPRPRPAKPAAGPAPGSANGPDTGEQLAGLAILAAIAAQQDMARRASAVTPVPRGPAPGAFPYGDAPLPGMRHGDGDQLAGFLAEIDAAQRED